MKIQKDMIIQRLDDLLPELIELRHLLHSFPETAGNEHKTRELLASVISPFDPILWRPKLGTDLVFEIPGRDPGRVIGFRSDMDGLPMQESSSLPYASTHEGVMHACGHDGHMVILLGAALILSSIRDSLPCTVRCIFQPGEEEACLGAELVKKGVCDGLERVYGFHNWPGIPLGTVSSKPGILFAAANTFRAAIAGTATHGAAPEKGNNPLIPAADAVLRIQQLHELLSARKEGVASVCMISGGTNTNIIPDAALVAGTTRYTESSAGDRIETAIRQIFSSVEDRYEVITDLQYERKYHLPVINDPDAVEEVRQAAVRSLGAGVYLSAGSHSMTAEDFAFYLERVPGCMFLLGTGADAPHLHAGDFDFNDEVIRTGVLLLVSLALGEVLH